MIRRHLRRLAKAAATRWLPSVPPDLWADIEAAELADEPPAPRDIDIDIHTLQVAALHGYIAAQRANGLMPRTPEQVAELRDLEARFTGGAR